jgi:alpha-mannosidase II
MRFSRILWTSDMQDARRKFIWEEMSYLERWWRDSSESKRESFINLVKNGQLEIVGGGWVMNDEVIFMGIYLN